MNPLEQKAPYGLPFLEITQTEKLEALSRASQEILKEHGFQRVMPPTLDYDRTFTSTNHSRFTLRDQQGEELALRSDVTLQLVKGLANHHDGLDWSKEQLFYYTVPVFKDIRKSYPALREVFQLGAEIFGSEPNHAIRRLLTIANQVIAKASSSRFQFIISDIRISKMLESFLGPVSKKIFLAKDAPALASLFQEKGFEKAESSRFSIGLFFHPLERFLSEHEEFLKKLEKQVPGLEEIWLDIQKLARSCNDNQAAVLPVPLIKRETDYYSGIIFEGYLEAKVNALIRGGSYNNLFRMVSDMDVSAAGFAFDLSAMIRN